MRLRMNGRHYNKQSASYAIRPIHYENTMGFCGAVSPYRSGSEVARSNRLRDHRLGMGHALTYTRYTHQSDVLFKAVSRLIAGPGKATLKRLLHL